MPLSEYEQRVLDELEQELGSDATLHRAMNRSSHTPTRVILGIVGVIAGLGIVVAGVAFQMPILGIVGFVLMAGVALWTLLAGGKKEEPKASDAAKPRPAPQGKPAKENKDFMQRFEDRFDRRRENGEF
ncbi:DUF3040 domain-containing protein [Demequina globuliformis]|uniref:DUF3040 domain-containing protein n=1 Tax=Demequina globuliformis TaxID=676202 RepID=UPI000784D8A5|nr:DUF3040 domain-containing protein [Demequina globuliformis]